MEPKLIKKPTQCQRILAKLEEAKGGWISGRYFIQNMLLSQYHARVFELQEQGHNIEASEDKDEFGFKSYRLKAKDTLF